MSIADTIKQPVPFLALMIGLACGIAAIAALAVSLMIGSALQSIRPGQPPAVTQSAVNYVAPNTGTPQ